MTHRIDLPYGHTALSLDLPDVESCRLLPQRPPVTAATPDSACAPPSGVTSAALENPIGTPRLADVVRPGERIAIVISDVTRPCPTADLLPPLLSELAHARVGDEDILIVSALGSHRAQSDEERTRLVGPDIFRRIRCIDSDIEDVTPVGRTRRSTPIEVFTPVVRADRRIGVGNIEYHYLAGYSGGYKAVVPGVCSLRTIEANHSLMVQAGAESGQIDGNPVREDIDEAGALIGVDFVLNVILDPAEWGASSEEHHAISAVAGHPIEAHREGCAQLNAFGRAPLPWLADVVLVSAGGFPKDVNLYQAQKALDHARLAVRPGGTIILVAECPEGLGHRVFAEWMLSGQTPDQLIGRIRERFVLGGHKAAAVALAQKRASIALVSSLPAGQCRAMGFLPYASPAEALADALAHVVIMPWGGSVLPVVKPCEGSKPSQGSARSERR